MEPLRLRVQFTKDGRMQYLSHSEFARTLMMAARRSRLPLLYSGRFRSHMKVSLSPPLPIGVTSECELVDFFLEKYISPAEAERALKQSLPQGIELVRLRLMGQGVRSVGKLIDTASYSAVIPASAGFGGDWKEAVEVFLGKESIPFERVQPRRTRQVDVRHGVHRLEAESADRQDDVCVTMVVDDGTRGTIKPFEVIKVLAELAGAAPGSWEKVRVHRQGLFVRRGDRLVSPMESARSKPAVQGPYGRRGRS